MQIEVAQLAVAITTVIAPFMPYLVDVAKRGTEEFIKTVATKGGQAAWGKAESIWRELKAQLGEDEEVASAAKLLAAGPGKEARQRVLADVLATKLQLYPELVEALAAALGGLERIQEITAYQGAWVEQVRLHMKGMGQQKVKAVASVVQDVKMDMD